jgi:hypothetical protein
MHRPKNEIVCVERVRKRAFHDQRQILSRRQFDRVTEAGEGDQAPQLVEAVGAAPQYLKREVQLGPGDVAKRAYCEVFWSVCAEPEAALVFSASSRPVAIFLVRVSACSSLGSSESACSH